MQLQFGFQAAYHSCIRPFPTQWKLQDCLSAQWVIQGLFHHTLSKPWTVSRTTHIQVPPLHQRINGSCEYSQAQCSVVSQEKLSVAATAALEECYALPAGEPPLQEKELPSTVDFTGTSWQHRSTKSQEHSSVVRAFQWFSDASSLGSPQPNSAPAFLCPSSRFLPLLTFGSRFYHSQKTSAGPKSQLCATC